MSALPTSPSQRDALIAQARGAFARKHLTHLDPLCEALREEHHRELAAYIYQLGMRRWRSNPRARWSTQYARLLRAMEQGHHDLCLEFVMLDASPYALGARLTALASRPPGLIAFGALKYASCTTRPIALRAFAHLLDATQVTALHAHCGLTPDILELLHARLTAGTLSLPASYLATLCKDVLGQLTQPEHAQPERLALLEAVISTHPQALICLGECLSAHQCSLPGTLERALTPESLRWVQRWLGSSLSPPCAPQNLGSEPLSQVEQWARRLRELEGVEERLEALFHTLKLSPAHFSTKNWSRIARAIDHAPTHEERLRLVSLLLKLERAPSAHARIARLIQHWSEHGSAGLTRRAGHKRSRRARRGAITRAATAWAEPEHIEDEWHYRLTPGFFWAHARCGERLDVEVTAMHPEDARERLEAIESALPVGTLTLRGMRGAPSALAALLASPRLAGTRGVVLRPHFDELPQAGMALGNMRRPSSHPAMQRARSVVEDAWVEQLLCALHSSALAASLEQLGIFGARPGTRSLTQLRTRIFPRLEQLRIEAITRLDPQAMLALSQAPWLQQLTEVTIEDVFRLHWEEPPTRLAHQRSEQE